MLNKEKIDKEILELENHDTTYATCEKLAMLYTVRDHINNGDILTYSEKSPEMEGSEFIEVSSNVDICDLLNILNEHMDVIKVLHPKEYRAIIEKIKALN